MSCTHENIIWEGDDLRGRCKDCGSVCDWHWEKDEGNVEDYYWSGKERVIDQWYDSYGFGSNKIRE